jgi:putative alpha-1,2-mannosidase
MLFFFRPVNDRGSRRSGGEHLPTDSMTQTYSTYRCVIAAAAVTAAAAFPQRANGDIFIRGHVRTPGGSPVENARVVLWDTEVASVSASDGSFTLKAPGDLPVPRLDILPKRIVASLPWRQNLQLDIFDVRGRVIFSKKGFGELSADRRRFGASFVIMRVSTPWSQNSTSAVLLPGVSLEGRRAKQYSRQDILFTSSTARTVQAVKDTLVSQRIVCKGDSAAGIVLILRNDVRQAAPVDYVDPFICTAVDYGQLSPAASVPWGLVKAGPDTKPGSHAGYDYNAKLITGFSHTRIAGVGCSGTGGSVLVKPGTDGHYRHCILHKETEVAQPGYYGVTLGSDSIRAELTVTGRTALHRYTYPAASHPVISLDLRHCYGGCCYTPACTVSGTTEVSGKVISSCTCCLGRFTLYFSAVFNAPFISSSRNDDRVTFTFPATSQGDRVLLKIGFSPVSTVEARRNRDSEIPGWDFDSVRNNARVSWNALLSRIEVRGREDYKTLFYTHLYNSLQNPMLTAQAGEPYMGTDCSVYTAQRPHYNSWSLWDTFRTKYPLLTLAAPVEFQDMAQSLVRLYQQGKAIDAGPCEPVPTVRTEFSVSILADAVMKKLRNISVHDAYPHMCAESFEKNVYDKSYNNWCLAQVAGYLGRGDDQAKFVRNAGEWKQRWEQEYKNIMTDPDADRMGTGLYEGTKWQHRWFVPHDVQGMINIVGGNRTFISELSHFFEYDLYNHGNEPDIQAAYLFNFAGAPWLTQKWVHAICATPMIHRYGTHTVFDFPFYGRAYTTRPDGYIPQMDDDAGTMAAWFVLSSMGLFQVCVGEPVFEIGTPLFKEVVIHLDAEVHTGETFIIRAENVSEANFYIQSATLNGLPFDRSWIAYDEIAAGGELVFSMGPQPNRRWASSPGAAPPSMSGPE